MGGSGVQPRTRGRAPTATRVRYAASLAGIVLGVGVGGAAYVQRHHWLARGPVMTGHARVACEHCHVPAPGSFRQQLQAKLWHVLGERSSESVVGRLDVSDERCIGCHARPDDRHPIFRFKEPRFAAARAELAPDQCSSCHREHAGRSLTRSADFCSTCHGDLALAQDPLEVSHERLVAGARWDTCLRCHDFHGNHERTTPTRMASGLRLDQLELYFETGIDPYGPRKHVAKER